jgi:hypothetical protein
MSHCVWLFRFVSLFSDKLRFSKIKSQYTFAVAAASGTIAEAKVYITSMKVAIYLKERDEFRGFKHTSLTEVWVRNLEINSEETSEKLKLG